MDSAMKTDTAKRSGRSNRKTINLALQEGGAHGAFTWGVLDCLLEDGRVDIEGITGTSAGAMNAAVVAQGLMAGGSQAARKALTGIWRRISHMGSYSPIQQSWVDRMLGGWSLDYSPSYIVFDLMTRLLSPYQLNMNPLRDLLLDTIDFERLKQCECIRLFVTATNVRTGKIKIFETPEISADVLLACACLPLLFQAVEVGGLHFIADLTLPYGRVAHDYLKRDLRAVSPTKMGASS